MTASSLPVLSLMIWCPILFGLLVLLAGRRLCPSLVRYIAFAGSLPGLVFSCLLAAKFDSGSAGMQFVENALWIERFNIRYALGIDGISLWLVALTAFILCIVIISAWQTDKADPAAYLGAFLILSGLITGTFCALDGLLFYVFFEATLVPMFVIIGIWGGENRIVAALKFFLYPFFGSLFMLVAIIYLYLQTGSFHIAGWYAVPLSLPVQIALFIGFALAFGIKLPMWPVHTWLPDAHVEAPAEGSVVLAALMLKLGGYGFIRLMLPTVPDAARALSGYMIALSLVAIIYIGLVALVQKDMKKLVAYSSIVHMGFVTLGFFLFQQAAVEGAMVQMISHGFVSAALFLCIGILYERTHSRQMADYGGVAATMPRFAALFVLFAVANCALPGTSGFIGEFMVIMGIVKANFWLGILTASSLILGAAYSLRIIREIVFGQPNTLQAAALKDISRRECFLLGLFATGVIAIGIYPAWLIDTMQPAIADLLLYISQSKIP
ncbi:MAG: NADH-quinone oxidoreductase subunit M [Alistipes senegalensis]|nr:NADH-quinone oxidoreductase subunit M [Oxalobacter formigenes]MCM1280411.1 NADH-quinone oxidoreductase subunit M [Alistipes senegalensis]